MAVKKVFGELSEQFNSISLQRGRELYKQSNVLGGYSSLLSRDHSRNPSKFNILLLSMPF